LEVREIELIVKQVLSNIDLNQINAGTYKNQEYTRTSRGDYGVFERVEDAIDAAYEAQKKYLEKPGIVTSNVLVRDPP